MPNRKEALMVQAVFAFAQGCGDAHIAEDAAEWFHERYYAWIDRKKQHGRSPQEAWDQEGKGFLGKFKEIGRQAVQGGAVDKAGLTQAALAVEQQSECPFCPDN
ncbi:MAG TPA: hypothetical protein VIA62_23200 [Thermoanaerobaculia bacterium]|jgi:hypothetical protein|nr:hypothetical protein [Thermoanaerobaculia bacterium]